MARIRVKGDWPIRAEGDVTSPSQWRRDLSEAACLSHPYLSHPYPSQPYPSHAARRRGPIGRVRPAPLSESAISD